MKKQTDKKSKVLQFDDVGEYKRDQFLQFGQNNDIDMHFTIQKQIKVAKEMNRALLEMACCLLSMYN